MYTSNFESIWSISFGFIIYLSLSFSLTTNCKWHVWDHHGICAEKFFVCLFRKDRSGRVKDYERLLLLTVDYEVQKNMLASSSTLPQCLKVWTPGFSIYSVHIFPLMTLSGTKATCLSISSILMLPTAYFYFFSQQIHDLGDFKSSENSFALPTQCGEVIRSQYFCRYFAFV